MLAAMPVSIATTRGPVELSVLLAGDPQWSCTPRTFTPAVIAAVTLLETMKQCRSSSLGYYANEGLPSTGSGMANRRVTIEAWRRDREGRTRLPEDQEIAGASLELPVALALFLHVIQLLTDLVDLEGVVVARFDPCLVATGALKNGDVLPVEDMPVKLDGLLRWLDAMQMQDGPVPFLVPEQGAQTPKGVRSVPILELHEALEFLLSAWLEANEGRIAAAVASLLRDPAALIRGPREWTCEQWATYGPDGYTRFVIRPARDRLAADRKVPLREEHPGRVLNAALRWSGQDVGERFDACLWRLAALRYVRQAQNLRPAPRAAGDGRYRRRDPERRSGRPAAGGAVTLEHVLRGDPELAVILDHLAREPDAPERVVLKALAAIERRLDEFSLRDRLRLLAVTERLAASGSGPITSAAVAVIERLSVAGSRRWSALRGALDATAPSGWSHLLVALTRQAHTTQQRRELQRLGRRALKGNPPAAVRRAAQAALLHLKQVGLEARPASTSDALPARSRP